MIAPAPASQDNSGHVPNTAWVQQNATMTATYQIGGTFDYNALADSPTAFHQVGGPVTTVNGPPAYAIGKGTTLTGAGANTGFGFQLYLDDTGLPNDQGLWWRQMNGANNWSTSVWHRILTDQGGTLTGALTAPSLTATGAITGATVTASGAITGATVTASGTVSGATVSGTNVNASGNMTASGTVTGANVTATGTVTGANINGANVNGTVVNSTNLNGVTLDVTGNSVLHDIYCDSTRGIIYRGLGGSHFIGFQWDPSGGFLAGYVDGTYIGEFATTGWVNGNYKPIGAYTPNQDVDTNASPTFGTMTAQTVVSTSGLFQVAPNYYLARGNDSVWRFVEGGTTDLTLGPNGDLWARGAMSATIFEGGPGNAAYLRTQDGQACCFSWDGGSLHYRVSETLDAKICTQFNAQNFGVVNNSDFGPSGVMLSLQDFAGNNALIYIEEWSDSRIKRDIRPTEVDALSLIEAIPVRAFAYTEPMANLYARMGGRDRRTGDAEIRLGLVAQELQALIPEAVSRLPADIHQPADSPIPDDALLISQSPLVPFLVRAVQQLSAEVRALKKGTSPA